jgi:hypothetical protein
MPNKKHCLSFVFMTTIIGLKANYNNGKNQEPCIVVASDICRRYNNGYYNCSLRYSLPTYSPYIKVRVSRNKKSLVGLTGKLSCPSVRLRNRLLDDENSLRDLIEIRRISKDFFPEFDPGLTKMFIAGFFDSRLRIYVTNTNGEILSGNCVCLGSGKKYAREVLNPFKERIFHNMPLNLAIDIATEAIAHAQNSDPYTKGFDLLVLTKDHVYKARDQNDSLGFDDSPKIVSENLKRKILF